MTTNIVANETENSDYRCYRDWVDSPALAGSYKPFPYRLGEICEPCWLTYAWVVPMGKLGCPHK